MSNDRRGEPLCAPADPNATPIPGQKYVAPRIQDMPVPGEPSLERHCSSCFAQVWVHYKTLHLADALPILCDWCALAEIADSEAGGSP